MPLLLVTPHSRQTENAIRILEQHNPETTWGLVGLLRLDRERLVAEPVTIHGETSINLNLDGLPANTVAGHARSTDALEPELEEPELELLESTSSLGILLTRGRGELEAVAEGGLRLVPRYRSAADHCQSMRLAGSCKRSAPDRPPGR